MHDGPGRDDACDGACRGTASSSPVAARLRTRHVVDRRLPVRRTARRHAGSRRDAGPCADGRQSGRAQRGGDVAQKSATGVVALWTSGLREASRAGNTLERVASVGPGPRLGRVRVGSAYRRTRVRFGCGTVAGKPRATGPRHGPEVFLQRDGAFAVDFRVARRHPGFGHVGRDSSGLVPATPHASAHLCPGRRLCAADRCPTSGGAGHDPDCRVLPGPLDESASGGLEFTGCRRTRHVGAEPGRDVRRGHAVIVPGGRDPGRPAAAGVDVSRLGSCCVGWWTRVVPGGRAWCGSSCAALGS